MEKTKAEIEEAEYRRDMSLHDAHSQGFSEGVWMMLALGGTIYCLFEFIGWLG